MYSDYEYKLYDNKDIVNEMKENSKFLLLTNDITEGENKEILAGEYRNINLSVYPFHFENVTEVFDFGQHGKKTFLV